MDYTAFEGMRVRGWPVTTISRGEVVWRDGTVNGASGPRPFVARARYGQRLRHEDPRRQPEHLGEHDRPARRELEAVKGRETELTVTNPD